ncbi:SAM-dependent methyltransferase [Sinomonas susongensis]|uniref:SAM-dependent methyltransferase n=1 Tax=Sinomonas susongensis TaxID=1324851 RepID=UPI001108E164|nr:SAM-dependent methyltransferase [Sinomonas susongensis]
MRKVRDDLRVPDAKADLYLLGLGIGGFDQRSVEADAILRNAAVVLHLTAFDKELREICHGRVEDLSTIYFSGTDPAEIYGALADQVAQTAIDNLVLGHTCFLNYGHPLFLVDTSWMLLDTPGLRVKAVAATSFLDQLICDLGYRFDFGAQIYEANWFLRTTPRLDPTFPLILSQVGHLNSERIEVRDRKLEWLSPLYDLLARTFPPERRCDLIFSSYRSDMAPQIVSSSIRDIQTMTSSVHSGTTLLVHGSRSK